MIAARRRFGSIRALPSGRYQARYPAPGGGTRTAPSTFARRTDAARYLSSIETDQSRGTWSDPLRGRVRLDVYCKTWLTDRRVKGRGLAPRTLDTYRHSIDAWIAPLIGGLPLTEITPAVVRSWHSHVCSETGPTATRQAYALLRAVLNTAVEDEILSRNPCRVKGAGQATSPERPLLDLDDVDLLVNAMPSHLRTLVIVTFWAHLRLGEVVALRRGDVSLDAGTVSVQRQEVETDAGPLETEPKVGSRRVVHLPSPARDALTLHFRLLPPALPSARLFVRPDGSPLRAHHVSAAWQTARGRVSLLDAHFHDLRHAGLTLSAQSGATLAEVMRRAGHASPRAALRYQHAAERRDVEIAQRLSAVAEQRGGA